MHMIRADFHLINGDVILLGNVTEQFFHPLLDVPS